MARFYNSIRKQDQPMYAGLPAEIDMTIKDRDKQQAQQVGNELDAYADVRLEFTPKSKDAENAANIKQGLNKEMSDWDTLVSSGKWDEAAQSLKSMRRQYGRLASTGAISGGKSSGSNATRGEGLDLNTLEGMMAYNKQQALTYEEELQDGKLDAVDYAYNMGALNKWRSEGSMKDNKLNPFDARVTKSKSDMEWAKDMVSITAGIAKSGGASVQWSRDGAYNWIQKGKGVGQNKANQVLNDAVSQLIGDPEFRERQQREYTVNLRGGKPNEDEFKSFVLQKAVGIVNTAVNKQVGYVSDKTGFGADAYSAARYKKELENEPTMYTETLAGSSQIIAKNAESLISNLTKSEVFTKGTVIYANGLATTIGGGEGTGNFEYPTLNPDSQKIVNNIASQLGYTFKGGDYFDSDGKWLQDKDEVYDEIKNVLSAQKNVMKAKVLTNELESDPENDYKSWNYGESYGKGAKGAAVKLFGEKSITGETTGKDLQTGEIFTEARRVYVPETGKTYTGVEYYDEFIEEDMTYKVGVNGTYKGDNPIIYNIPEHMTPEKFALSYSVTIGGKEIIVSGEDVLIPDPINKPNYDAVEQHKIQLYGMYANHKPDIIQELYVNKYGGSPIPLIYNSNANTYTIETENNKGDKYKGTGESAEQAFNAWETSMQTKTKK